MTIRSTNFILTFEDYVASTKGFILHMQRDGSLTIPSQIREQLGLTTDNTLVVRAEEDGTGFWVDCLGPSTKHTNRDTR